MSLQSLLRSACTVKRQSNPQSAKDRSGGPVPSWVAVPNLVGVPCDVQPADAATVERFAQRNIVVHSTVFFARDIGSSTLRAGDRLEVTDLPTGRIRYLLFVKGGYAAGAAGYAQPWPSVAHVQETPTGP